MSKMHIIPADGSWYIVDDSETRTCSQVVAWALSADTAYEPQPITIAGEAFEVATHQHSPAGECFEHGIRDALNGND